MPELPEVEVIRAGLASALGSARIEQVHVYHPRAVRKIPGGEAELREAVRGARIEAFARRGKFLWLELGEDRPALVVHLGMSGQLLVDDEAFDTATRHYPVGRGHERARFECDGAVLRFVDQRTFGFLAVSELGAGVDGRRVPRILAHIAPDALELSVAELAERLRGRPREIKRVILDQNVVSGIGNIYADESLWGARISPRAKGLSRDRAMRLAQAIQEVLLRALAAGGTSFDQLYRNAAGESGYFARELAVYGKAGEPCPRCGAAIRSEAFAGRHSHFCPHCQRR